MKKSDTYIIRKLKRSSQRAFKVVFDMFHVQVRYAVVQLVKDVVEADDITSETFTKLWNRRTDFDSLQSIKAFLFITARNAGLDYLRQQQRQTKQENEACYILQHQETGRTICEEIEENLLEHLYLKMGHLAPQGRRIIKMAYVDGLRNKEIARQLNVKLQTVKNIKRQALAILRNDEYCQEMRLLLSMNSCRR